MRFWDTHSIDYTDVKAARDQFADYALLAAEAPEKDALRSVDVLYDHLRKDEVAYSIYSDWAESAFYNFLSPSHSPVLFAKVVDRIVKDGIIPNGISDDFVRKREWAMYNLQGAPATVPGVVINERTLVLVLDKGCPSCHASLTKMADYLPEARHIAVCCGFGPDPDISGWEYINSSNSAAIFDPHMTPVFFVVAADGTVESSYQVALK